MCPFGFQSRALGKVNSLHGNKMLSRVEKAIILTGIEFESLNKEVQRESPPWINANGLFSFLTFGVFSNCSSMRRRHQNRHPCWKQENLEESAQASSVAAKPLPCPGCPARLLLFSLSLQGIWPRTCNAISIEDAESYSLKLEISLSCQHISN